MSNILILIGPQGAGNHLWSKIFSLHPEVFGWKSLLDNYWEPHRFNEPFAGYWRDPTKLSGFDWQQKNFYLTSISIPLGIPGSTENPLWEPNLKNFMDHIPADIKVEVAVLGRDQNILNKQQTRIRTKSTLPLFMDQLDQVMPDCFLSYELLYLYGSRYLKSLTNQLSTPIAWNDPRVAMIIQDDANSKYIHSIADNELDLGNKTGRIFKNKP